MTLKQQIDDIKLLINKTAYEWGRNPKEITLLAVSKTQPAARIREAYQLGISHFAENYWQEAESKIKELSDLSIWWHFIGPLQSNKAAFIANHFDWVHSLSREKIALLLAKHRSLDLPPLNVCIQVNLDEEKTKSGLLPTELTKLVKTLRDLPNLKLRGLMTIPKPLIGEEEQYQSLLRLRELFLTLNHELHLGMDTLSMGMSDDLIAAIKAGSTMVRIGRAIFGERLF